MCITLKQNSYCPRRTHQIPEDPQKSSTHFQQHQVNIDLLFNVKDVIHVEFLLQRQTGNGEVYREVLRRL